MRLLNETILRLSIEILDETGQERLKLIKRSFSPIQKILYKILAVTFKGNSKDLAKNDRFALHTSLERKIKFSGADADVDAIV